MSRCRVSPVVAAPGRGALCQLGFALRRDVVCGGGVARAAEAEGVAGESFTYGKTVWSSLLATCSWVQKSGEIR